MSVALPERPRVIFLGGGDEAVGIRLCPGAFTALCGVPAERAHAA